MACVVWILRVRDKRGDQVACFSDVVAGFFDAGRVVIDRSFDELLLVLDLLEHATLHVGLVVWEPGVTDSCEHIDEGTLVSYYKLITRYEEQLIDDLSGHLPWRHGDIDD